MRKMNLFQHLVHDLSVSCTGMDASMDASVAGV